MGKEEKFTTSLVREINKDIGEETLWLMEDGSPSEVKDFISTGSTLLDYCISNQANGGIPVSKITEISGLEGTGKTLLAMQICANTQKAGGLAIYIDTENAFVPDFAERIGLDVKNNFIYANPTTVEDVFTTIFATLHRVDAMEKSTKTLPFKFVTIVWDSVAATPTSKDVSDENPDPGATVGYKPRILSKNIYTLIKTAGRNRVALVFLNQLRMKINSTPFSDPYIEPGGKAIPFASSVRVRLKLKGKIKVGEQVVGTQVVGVVQKTRFGPPYRQCEFGVFFKNGVDDTESIIEMIVEKGAIGSKSGGPKGKMLFFKGETEAYTRSEFKAKMKSDPQFTKRVMELVEGAMVEDLWGSESDELSIEPPGEGG